MSEETNAPPATQPATDPRPKVSAARRRVSIAILIVLVAIAVTIAVGTIRKRLGYGRNISTRVGERTLYSGPTTQQAAAEDWPQWRGPRGDGISREQNLLNEWPEEGPRRLWVADVGIGHSSPIAAAGRVYLLSMNESMETLTCFDANSGKIIWNREGTRGWDTSYPGTRATPTIEGQFIYTYGGQGDLICRTLADGKERWRTNVLSETGSTNGGWGCASSPLIVGDLIYVQSRVGGPVAVAVNKNDGKLAWQSEARGPGGYAQAVLADVEGTKHLIVFGGDTLYGMNPQDGKTIWSERWPTAYETNASTPIYSRGHVFVTSSNGQGCMMLKLSPAGATKLWEHKEIQSHYQPTILEGDLLYANSQGTLKTMRWPDGGVMWAIGEFKLGNGGSMVRLPGNNMILQSDRGRIGLVNAQLRGFAPISSFEGVDGTETWATPLVYGGRLYAKGTSELVCYDISRP